MKCCPKVVYEMMLATKINWHFVLHESREIPNRKVAKPRSAPTSSACCTIQPYWS